ncbi:MAG TPA: YafY family protein [Actinophytocola sp.]|jgi:predicted DNA-binding transcriptional regulator YafY|uniref:helix-turn-helix transcriptional regulator n=1 Tax=Actinophytocola sp. TaxID=1872138 RepID=UPI002F9471D2
MNRTDRLYAIVEDLRAVAPRRRSARLLAERYEVSVRTIERDIGALQQAGVPIYADTGRRGGYTLDPAMTLPPLNFTPAEAVAVSVALRAAVGSPFAREAESALRKIMAAMPARQASAAHELAERVQFMTRSEEGEPAGIPLVIENALAAKRVLRIDYIDKNGVPTEREVEPVMFLAGVHGWYLVAWCRLREQLRAFRVDRIITFHDTGRPAPARPAESITPYLPDNVTRVAALA